MLKLCKCVTYILVLVGALNWGLIGLFNFDLVATLFGQMTSLTRIVYSLVGVCAILSPITMHMYHSTLRD